MDVYRLRHAKPSFQGGRGRDLSRLRGPIETGVAGGNAGVEPRVLQRQFFAAHVNSVLGGVAADTFRAAAIEQIAIWAERAGADIVRHKDNADPAAVAFDAVARAKARGHDVIIIDTAEATKTYVENKRATLPDDVELTVWADVTYYLEGRLGMMVRNLAMGALLVFIILALFLEIKLAF